MKNLYDVTHRQVIRLWVTYGTLFLLVLVAGYFLSQGVINQPWTARTHMGTAVIDDRIYIVGGQSNVTGELLNDIWEVAPDEARLRAMGKLPYNCYLPEVAAIQDMLFVVGGYDGDTYRSEILQVTDGNAEIIGRLPSPRGYGASIGVGDSVYYAGGCDRTGMLDEIVLIHPDSGMASIVAHLPSPRRFVEAAELEGFIYFVGGEDSESQFLDEIIEFDPTTRQIVRTGHLPTGRYLVNLVAWNGRLLALGGKGTRSLDDVVSIDPSGPAITSQVVDHIAELSWSLSVESIGNRLFIVGGEHPDFKRAIGLSEYFPDSEPSLLSIQLRKNPWK